MTLYKFHFYPDKNEGAGITHTVLPLRDFDHGELHGAGAVADQALDLHEEQAKDQSFPSQLKGPLRISCAHEALQPTPAQRSASPTAPHKAYSLLGMGASTTTLFSDPT